MSRKPADDYLFEREAVEEWEELFNRKCDMLRNRIAQLVVDIVFTTEGRYACKICQCRIKAWRDDKEYCVRCSPLPYWTREIQEIMQEYPSFEECKKEMMKSVDVQHGSTTPNVKTGNTVLGAKMQTERKKKGMTREDLACKIFNKKGQHISFASIKGYEKGYALPPKHILEQIERILTLEEIRQQGI